MRASLRRQELYFKQISSKWKYVSVIPSLPLVAVLQITQPLTGLSSRECKLVEGRDVNCLDFGDGDHLFSVSVLACTDFRQL